jgi:hypothetical protein
MHGHTILKSGVPLQLCPAQIPYVLADGGVRLSLLSDTVPVRRTHG